MDETDNPTPKGERIAPPRGERIAKVIARAGVCSRREAEVLVEQGRVTIDGKTIRLPSTTVVPGQRITVDGEAIPTAEPARLFRFHKPVGVLTTAKDPEGRQTFYDGLPEHLPRVMPVGRLDINSEGLLLLTNDGGLKRHLELPATGWLRRYRVRVWGRVETHALAALQDGVTVEGVRYGPIQAKLDSQQASNAWITFTLQEGKNREIRQVCRHLGLQVNRLIRVAYGPFQLGALPEGGIEEVPQKSLKEQLGAFLPDALSAEEKRAGRKARSDNADTRAEEKVPPAPEERQARRAAARRGTSPAEIQDSQTQARVLRRASRSHWTLKLGTAPERQRNKAKDWTQLTDPKANRGSSERPARSDERPTRSGADDTARSPGQERRRPGAPATPARGPGRPERGERTGGKPGGRPGSDRPGSKPGGRPGGRPSGGKPSGPGGSGKGPGGARRRG